MVVAATTLVALVVLRSPGPVVLDLFGEQLFDRWEQRLLHPPILARGRDVGTGFSRL
jgi:hypothetical protein